jgi:CRP-like cAMP-binding protein
LEHTYLKLAGAAVFKGVPCVDLKSAISQARILDYRDDEVIIARGDPGDRAFLIISGTVRVGTLGEDGKRVTIEILREQEVFGELGVIDRKPRIADVVAMGPTKVAAIPAAEFLELLGRSPIFAMNLLRLTTARLRRCYTLFEDASLMSLEHRFARQVLYLMRLGAADGQRVRIYSRLHQGELADLLGTTPRSIINILNKWRSNGLVEFDGRAAQLTILDLERFNGLVGDETSRKRERPREVAASRRRSPHRS